MEPNKLDKEFKEKLDKRVIAPSAMAWDRLDAMLTVAEGKKPEKNRNWLFIAAGFIGFMLMAALFFNYSKNTVNTPVNNTIVTNNATPAVQENNELPIGIPEEKNSPEQKYSTTKEAFAVAVKKSGRKVVPQKTDVTVQDAVIAENTPVAQNEIIKLPETGQEAQNLLAVTAAKQKKQPVKVDAGKLLNSVESEIDYNYRNRALQTVAKNYNVIKSTLANRNHQ